MVVDTKLYDILGCSPDASEKELKKAFMMKAKILHPDKNQDDPDATEKFQELNEAYEILKDPETREVYDKYGPEGLKEGGHGDFGDIISHLFGFDDADSSRRPKTRDIIKEIPATLEELYNGAEKKVVIDRHISCPVCRGNGCKEGTEPDVCKTCGGQGQVLTMQNIPGMGRVQSVASCPDCHGAGKSIKQENKCEKCDGESIIQESKEFICHVERGMKDGSHIVFQGESDDVPGADPGDLVVVVREESHPIFVRRNDDLLYQKEINLGEALFGAKFVVDTLDDRQLIVETKQGEIITPDTVKSIEHEGMPCGDNPFNRGKLFIKFSIKFPKAEKLTPEFKKLLLAISPQEPITVTNQEEAYPVKLHPAEMDEFTSNQSTHKDKRREAYAEDDDNDYDDDNDEDGGQANCQPM